MRWNVQFVQAVSSETEMNNDSLKPVFKRDNIDADDGNLETITFSCIGNEEQLKSPINHTFKRAISRPNIDKEQITAHLFALDRSNNERKSRLVT